MCVHLNALPDDCLLPILDRIPLHNLLWLDQVCHRWAKLLPSATVRRRSLVMILGGRRVDEMEWNIPFNNTFDLSFYGRRPCYDLPMAEREASVTVQCLVPQTETFDDYDVDGDELEGFFDILYREGGFHLEEEDFTEMARFERALLSGQLCAYFAGLLPNVNKLVVVHTRCYEDELFSLIDLLGSWSLVVLKLWLRFPDPITNYIDRPEQHPVHALLQAIQQSSLQQLTLDIDSEDADEDPLDEQVYTFPAELYSFIGQLKVVKLFLEHYDGTNLIWNTIHRFDSPALSEISFGKYMMPAVDVALSRRFKFTPKVRQLYWSVQFESVEQFDRFCWQFSSLTMLQMYWSRNITLARLVSTLASLKQLSHLKLSFTFRNYHENPFEVVEGDPEEGRLMSLPQVTNLELLMSHSHRVFEPLCPLTFPSVKVIIVRNFARCAVCHLDIVNEEYNQVAANRCCHMLFSSLRDKFASPSVRIFAEDVTDFTGHFKEYVRRGGGTLPEDEVEE